MGGTSNILFPKIRFNLRAFSQASGLIRRHLHLLNLNLFKKKRKKKKKHTNKQTNKQTNTHILSGLFRKRQGFYVDFFMEKGSISGMIQFMTPHRDDPGCGGGGQFGTKFPQNTYIKTAPKLKLPHFWCFKHEIPLSAF